MMYDPSTLGIMPIKPRFATQEIQNLLTHFPVVALHGAPQVGKSVIARDLADRTGGIFVDLDDPDPYAFAYQEPLAFMRQVLRLNMALLKNPGECGGFLFAIRWGTW